MSENEHLNDICIRLFKEYIETMFIHKRLEYRIEVVNQSVHYVFYSSKSIDIELIIDSDSQKHTLKYILKEKKLAFTMCNFMSNQFLIYEPDFKGIYYSCNKIEAKKIFNVLINLIKSR